MADETPDELPALLAFAIAIAILVIALVWPTIRDRETPGPGQEVASAAQGEGEDLGDAEEQGDAQEQDDAAGEALPEVGRFESELAVDGLQLSLTGNAVIAEGEVTDEATRARVIDYLRQQPNVESVEDRLTIAGPPGEAAVVSATAAQASIVLEGNVPDEVTEAALVTRTAEVYRESQIDNRLVVDPSAQPPVMITIGGAMTDEVLFRQVQTAFDGLDGVIVGDSTIALEESSELEAALLALEPIQFASGSAVVDEVSRPILDQAAELLNAEPDTTIEIGGHTDSVGGEEANQSLSQARAESVMAALIERGVTNAMTAEGFGESRLKVDPDDNDSEAQRANRRIEFRVLS